MVLRVWCDTKGILHFEISPSNQKISSNVYDQQLAKLSNAIQEKWPKLANHNKVGFHDNIKPDTFWSLKKNLN